MNSVHEQNRRAWDQRVQRGLWYVDTATADDFRNPLAVADPYNWFGGDVTGKRILCLAAGGGRHSVLLASAGAHITVLDLSPQMLALDRKTAADRNLTISALEGSMENLSMFQNQSFDAVIQPVSTCYVPDILPVYREVARILAETGIYVSQHKQPANLQAAASPNPSGGYLILEPYYRNGPLPPVAEGLWHREAGTLEFLHRWEDLLGGLCRSGFVIEDVTEPRHADANAAPGSFPHRSCYIPPYIAIKARRQLKPEAPPPRIWLPGSLNL
jgi:SAM-dependent methyltransferase